MAGMLFRVLGPLEVFDGSGWRRVGAAKSRALIARLLIGVGRVVPLDEIVAALWGDHPPRGAVNQIHGYVMRLRRLLGDAAGALVVTHSPGYRLAVTADEIDAGLFESLAAQGHAAARADDQASAAELFGRALALWRGSAFSDVPATPVVAAEAGRLEELRLVATEARVDADLAAGRTAELVSELSGLVDEHPLRERLWAQLMQALYRSGRQAEALAAYQRLFRLLDEELGVPPSAAVQQLHAEILAGKAELPAAIQPAQLPAELPTFTGRSEELSRLLSADDSPISAINGMAGVGKTTLAVHAAHRLAPRFPDGQLFLDLHGFTPDSAPVDPADALNRLLRALGMSGPQIPPDVEDRAALYRSRLAGTKTLILLDNAASEAQVAPLLPAAPDCRVLITSRARLSGLAHATPLSLDVLPLPDAVAMFVRITGRDLGSPELVAQIVELCGRLPLAIQIAATRLRHHPSWTPGYLATRLRDERRRLSELRTGELGVAAAFHLSYRQLDPAQRRMFRLLGLHPGADIDEHAAAALAGDTVPEAGRLLEGLLDAHLVSDHGEGRYRCHDLLRAYAAELAAEEPEADRRAAVTRLLDHYTYVAAAAMDLMYPSERAQRPRVSRPPTPAHELTDTARASEWLDAERGNLLAVASHAADNGWPVHIGHLAQILFRYLDAKGDFADAHVLHGKALDSARAIGDLAGEARAATNLGVVYLRWARYDRALDCYRRSLSIAESLDDRAALARALGNLGLCYERLGRYEEALEHHRRNLATVRSLGDRSGEARALGNLGEIHERLGHYEDALECHLRNLALAGATGDRVGAAVARGNLGVISARLGRLQDALAHLRHALALFHDLGERVGEAQVLTELGTVHQLLDSHDAALDHHRRALDLFRDVGDPAGESTALNNFGAALRGAGRPGEALESHRRALALADRAGEPFGQARAHDGLAAAYRDLDAGEHAREHWLRALDIFAALGVPEADEVRAHLGQP